MQRPYTNNSKIDIFTKFDEAKSSYIIKIRDYGPGVPDHMLDRLFDPFFRVHSDRSQKLGGYGLGLAIAKRAVLSHKGEIIAKSHKEGGLIVVITLPLTPIKNEA